jgi:hypothetical protein
LRRLAAPPISDGRRRPCAASRAVDHTPTRRFRDKYAARTFSLEASARASRTPFLFTRAGLHHVKVLAVLAPVDGKDRSFCAETGDRPRSTYSVRSALRAESYLALAKQSVQLAESSELPHVRRKHELAAKTWLELAELEAQPLRGPSRSQRLTRA